MSSGDLLENIAPVVKDSGNKVSIIGSSQLGGCIAFALLTKGIANHIALIDAAEEKALGEAADLQLAAAYLNNAVISGSSNYEITSNSQVCIIVAGERLKGEEWTFDFVLKNSRVIRDIVPKIVCHSPNAVLIVYTEPCDVMTWLVREVSGFPKSKVIGLGTLLETSVLSSLLSQQLEIAPSNCQTWVIGEHGPSSIPLWSNIMVSGVPYTSISPWLDKNGEPDEWNQLPKMIDEAQKEVVALKGVNSLSLALGMAEICKAILQNDECILTVSTCAKNYHCIEDDIFLSLPCVIGETGVAGVVLQHLSPTQKKKLQKSAGTLADVVRCMK